MKKPGPQPGPNREKVRDLSGKGLTPRQIALALGLSTQRVYVILRNIADEPQEVAS